LKESGALRCNRGKIVELSEKTSFQRFGSESNAQVGSDFEKAAKSCFEELGLHLHSSHKLLIGVGQAKKCHSFDLGCSEKKVIVECKSHRWTTGSNIPSAKLTVWNEAMYYFHLAPSEYRKIMFVLRDVCARRELSLGYYYLKNYAHLVPPDVEFWEFDEDTKAATRIHGAQVPK